VAPQGLAADQKNACDRGGAVAFLDESGFAFRPLALRTWAPRGKTPILVNSEKDRRTLSAISAIVWRPKARRPRRRFALYFNLHDGPIKTKQVIDFLQHLLRHVRVPIQLAWDRLGAHRSAETCRFLERRRRRITTHFFPPYAPDTNPDEYVWGHAKKNGLAHYTPDHRSHLRAEVQRVFTCMQPRHKLIAAFVRAAGLSTDMDERQ
jgi:transposase